MANSKIEHLEEIPKPRRRGRPSKYPFSELGVGDSFVAKSTYKTLHKCMKNFEKACTENGCRFQITVGDRKGLWRVTRIA